MEMGAPRTSEPDSPRRPTPHSVGNGIGLGSRTPRTPPEKSAPDLSICESSHESSRESSREYNRDTRVQDLLGKLHREEKIRDAAEVMLADLNHGQGQHKLHSNMIKQLNSLNALKPDTLHKRKVKQQLEAAEQHIEQITQQLVELGFDEDDDISSGDEDGSTSMLFAPDDMNGSSTFDAGIEATSAYLRAPPPPPPPLHPLGMSLSATPSLTDLNGLSTQSLAGGIASDSHSHHTRDYSPVGSALLPDAAMRVFMKAIDSLDADASDAKTTIDKLAEIRRLQPGVAAELSNTAPWELISERLRPFFLVPDSKRLCSGLRLVRLTISDSHAVSALQSSLFLDYILEWVLSKDDKDLNHYERLQALQLIRAILSIPGAASELSLGVYRAMVAVAEQGNDKVRHICLEILAELLVIDPERACAAGSVKVLLSAIIDPKDDGDTATAGNLEFPLALTMAFLDVADDPELRSKYLRDGKDLSAILTPFTDVQLYGFAQPSTARMQMAASVMIVMLRNWAGLCCFDLTLLVQCLSVPLRQVQETLLDVLDAVLTPPGLHIDGKYGTAAPGNSCLPLHFAALLLNRLQRSGLQEKLTALQSNAHPVVQEKAQQLGSKLYLLSARLVPRHKIESTMEIPLEVCETLAKAPLHTLPTASLALFEVESKLRQLMYGAPTSIDGFVRFGVLMDDTSFKNLIAATHVLDTKLQRQWNWDALLELVQGPLRSPKRVEDVTRGSKFMKRLLSFYRPFKYRFSNLSITKEHMRYVHVGKELILTLLETSEGVKYLGDNKIFRQIAECFAQLDPYSGIMSNEPLFSSRRFRSTLCCAYSELIGVLTHSRVGQQILEKMRVFNMYYRICDINREDVVRSVICAMDYKLEGHPRLILAKALASASRNTRIFATEFASTRLAGPEPQYWVIDLLVAQLYDVDIVVANAAAQGLQHICSASEKALDYVISCEPFLGHLGDAAEPLRFLFLGRPKGFMLLGEDMVSTEIEHWVLVFNNAYVERIEAYLEAAISAAGSEPTKLLETAEPFTFPSYSRPTRQQHGAQVAPPPHVFGELALTEQGCRLLKTSGCIESLANEVAQAARNAKRTKWGPVELCRVKGALWAIGHIASRTKGSLLLNIQIARDMCEICRSATVYNLRGTTFYALGLFALSLSGAEFLHQCGWLVVYDVHSRPTGVALPPEGFFDSDHESETRRVRSSKLEFLPNPKPDFEKDEEIFVDAESVSPKDNKSVPDLLVEPPPSHFSDNDSHSSDLTDRRIAPPIRPPSSTSSLKSSSSQLLSAFDFETEPGVSHRRSSCLDLIEFPHRRDPAADSIVRAVGQLGSYVVAEKAWKRLAAMRTTHAALFKASDVFKEVMRVLEVGHYKQFTRRFVFELFNVPELLEKLHKRRIRT